MPTLFLGPRQTEDSQRLWRTASQIGWRVERLATWRIPDELLDSPEPVVYVEAMFAPMLAESLGIKLVEPPDDWLPSLPMKYRGRAVDLVSAGEARKNLTPLFVKPPNDKNFPAAVRTGPEIPEFVTDDTPVLVQEVVEWETEFRCFILGRELRTFSVYLRNGELQKHADYESTPAEDADVLAFVSRVLCDERVPLPYAVVMDVGVIRNRGWAVVELNAAWGSGLYGCDPAEVLKVIRHAGVKTE
jgi:hypothetical protein